MSSKVLMSMAPSVSAIACPADPWRHLAADRSTPSLTRFKEVPGGFAGCTEQHHFTGRRGSSLHRADGTPNFVRWHAVLRAAACGAHFRHGEARPRASRAPGHHLFFIGPAAGEPADARAAAANAGHLHRRGHASHRQRATAGPSNGGRRRSEAESCSGVPERRAKRCPIQAQSAVIARAMARICNDDRTTFCVIGGHERT